MAIKLKNLCCFRTDNDDSDNAPEASPRINISAPYNFQWVGGTRQPDLSRLSSLRNRQSRQHRAPESSYMTITQHVHVETVQPHEQLEHPVSTVEIVGGSNIVRRNVVPRNPFHGPASSTNAHNAFAFPHPPSYAEQHTSTQLSDGSRRLSSLLMLPSVQRLTSLGQSVRPVSRFSWNSSQPDIELENQRAANASAGASQVQDQALSRAEQPAKISTESNESAQQANKLKKKATYAAINVQAKEDASANPSKGEEQDDQETTEHQQNAGAKSDEPSKAEPTLKEQA